MAKAVTTIKQVLNYSRHQGAWFAATQTLFNQIAAFYFEVIQAHEGVLDLSNKEALTALETLTHATRQNPNPVVPLVSQAPHVPAMFRRAAIHAALGSLFLCPPGEVAKQEGESPGKGQEVQRASTCPTTHVE